jgi:hypothetical protein
MLTNRQKRGLETHRIFCIDVVADRDARTNALTSAERGRLAGKKRGAGALIPIPALLHDGQAVASRRSLRLVFPAFGLTSVSHSHLLVESFYERANATRLHDNDGDIIARSARRTHAMGL